jgi:hypothetical protein
MRGNKKKAGIVFIALLFILTMVASAQQAQPYAVPWWAIGGGGGTSIGGDYTLSGTIGQSDAGRLSGGSFSVEGGFWGPLVPYYLYLPLVLT